MQINGVRKRVGIRRNYWIVFAALISFSSAKALTTIVEPITIPDGIWRVLSRVGNALDTLSPCIFGIQQTDIPLTITNPGYYCFNQDLIFTTTGIIIATNNVTIDFNAHTLDGQNNNNGVGILLTNGAQNIVIKNGTIQNIGGSLSAGIADVNNGLVLNNIAIQDMSFINIIFGSIQLCSEAVRPDVDGLIVERCTMYNGGDFLCCGNNIVIRSCTLNTRELVAPACFSFLGKDRSGLQGENVLIEDLILTSTFGNAGGCLLLVQNWYSAELRNCQMDGGRNINFDFVNVVHLRVSDCVSRFGVGTGFNTAVNGTVHELKSAIFERCVAQDMSSAGFGIAPTGGNVVDSAVFIDCVAQNCGAGFTTNPVNNLVMRNCTASKCGTGIQILAQGGVPLGSNSVLENCVAQACTTGGFIIGTTGATTNQNIVLRNCIAQQNTGIGFLVQHTNHCVIEGCIAQRNSGIGFSLLSTAIDIEMIQCRALRNGGAGISNLAIGNNNFIFGCTSLGNTGGDYVGVGFGDLTKIVSYSQIGATATADFWRNIKS